MECVNIYQIQIQLDENNLDVDFLPGEKNKDFLDRLEQNNIVQPDFMKTIETIAISFNPINMTYLLMAFDENKCLLASLRLPVDKYVSIFGKSL